MKLLFLHVSDSSAVHRQEFFTVHTAIHTGDVTYTIAMCTVKKS